MNGKEYRVKKEEDLKAARIFMKLNGQLSAGETCIVHAAAVREEGERLIISEVSAAGDRGRFFVSFRVFNRLQNRLLKNRPPEKQRLKTGPLKNS